MPTPMIASISTDVAALSPEAIVIGALTLAAGVVLWAFGRRLLRTFFLSTGGLLGAVAGYVTALAVGVPAPAWTVALAGGIVVAIMAWLAYRPVIGLVLALLMGLACPVGVIAWAEHRGMNLMNPPVELDEETNTIRSSGGDFDLKWEDFNRILKLLRDPDSVVDNLRAPGGSDKDSPSAEAQKLRNNDTSATARETDGWRPLVKELTDGIVEDIRLRWDAAPQGVRLTIMLSAACGAILGFLVGIFVPSIAASILTALIGSGLILGGGSMIGLQVGAGDIPFLQVGGVTWLIAWLVLAAAGIVIQWTFRRKRADKESD